MARMARVVAPGVPHHITQRGNRRQKTFFRKKDYELYIDLVGEWCHKEGVELWAWCLMPNHIHLIAVPPGKESLTKAISEAHRRYTKYINSRKNWRGHLWQGRYASYPMDEQHVFHCARYIEMNPVRSGLVRQPEDWPYSSARAHLDGQNDELVNVTPLLKMASDWRAYLMEEEENSKIFHCHERTGRPLGSNNFIQILENQLDRKLMKEKPGRKRKRRGEAKK
jgi:REP-associated tyrosine transposase